MSLLDKLKGLDPQVIFEAVEKVEETYTELKGSDKKEKAIELINAAIDIPLLTENQEEKLLGFALDKIIDIVVALYNKFKNKV